MPDIQCIDMRMMPKGTLFAPKLLHAMRERVDLGEQVMVLLNRRGWAPVLMCSDCDWKSQCPHCSAYRVFHREDRTLRCHHCALTHKVPRMCPSCGNLDLGWQGRGTEQLQDHLENWFAQQPHPSGRPYAVMRMDADSTRLKGSLEDQLSAVHAGQIDVLVGTQMIAKGHDFKRMGMWWWQTLMGPCFLVTSEPPSACLICCCKPLAAPGVPSTPKPHRQPKCGSRPASLTTPCLHP
jgi:primosomal protein N' (replication factor Y)